jgi:hypothetical protein
MARRPTRQQRRGAVRQRAARDANARPHVPLDVRFVDQTPETYVVQARDEFDMQMVRVPKHRAAVEWSSAGGDQSARATGLLRWSLLALIGAACGGIGGILLGALVACASAVRLARFSRRVRRWRRRQRQRARRGQEVPGLPEAATLERLRLLAALGQGFLAMVAGAAEVLLLSGRLGALV